MSTTIALIIMTVGLGSLLLTFTYFLCKIPGGDINNMRPDPRIPPPPPPPPPPMPPTPPVIPIPPTNRNL